MSASITFKRFFAVVILALFLILLWSLRPSVETTNPATRPIEGQWRQVYAALGIKDLPDQVFAIAPAPLKPRRKFDLRRRRMMGPAGTTEGEDDAPALFLARDAVATPLASVSDLKRRLQGRGGVEKEGGRGTGRKPSSRATIKIQKDELGR